MPESASLSKKEKALGILRHLLDKNFEAYLVGGCVRDRVMGIEPPDYDIATSAKPEEVQKLFRRTVPVGAHFGVILVLEGDDQFEVATFRADDAYIDGRRPVSVRFVSAEEDAQRRDFTINGLFYDARNDKIIDYVGGLKDIQDRIVRTIGDPEKRFQEDRLRLMRAVRFAGRFGFAIEPATLSALKKQAETILSVSWERIREELVKILMNRNPDKGVRLLLETGLLKAILPELVALVGVKQPDTFHPEGDVFDHTMKLLTLMDGDETVTRTVTLALSALLHDIGKPRTYYEAKDRIRFHNHHVVGKAMSRDILRRLKCSNDVIEDVSFCVENHMNFMNAPKMRENTLKRFIRAPTFPVELILHRLDCLASHGDLSTYDFLKRKTEELGKEKISPPPLINGKKLVEMGYAPGPLFKKILTAVEDLQLLEKISTPGDAERFVRENYPL